jgi:hypothetical protein
MAGPESPIETPTQMAALTMRRVTVEVILFHTGRLIAERAGRWCLPTEKRGSADIGRVPRSITGVMADRSPSGWMESHGGGLAYDQPMDAVSACWEWSTSPRPEARVAEVR